MFVIFIYVFCQSLFLFGFVVRVCAKYQHGKFAVIPPHTLLQEGFSPPNGRGWSSEKWKCSSKVKYWFKPQRERKWQTKSSTGPLCILVSTWKAVAIKSSQWLSTGCNRRWWGAVSSEQIAQHMEQNTQHQHMCSMQCWGVTSYM